MAKNCGFYWLVKGKLAGSAYPAACLDQLYQTQGIRAVLSLHSLQPHDLQRAKQLGFQLKTVEIPDFTAGSPEQRNLAIKIIEEFQKQNLPTLVHCQGGLGRTGMILALYLVQRMHIPPKSAISQIRHLQIGSIEANTGQEEVILSSKYRGEP